MDRSSPGAGGWGGEGSTVGFRSHHISTSQVAGSSLVAAGALVGEERKETHGKNVMVEPRFDTRVVSGSPPGLGVGRLLRWGVDLGPLPQASSFVEEGRCAGHQEPGPWGICLRRERVSAIWGETPA